MFAAITLLCIGASAQTNVSGGITSNTTWSLSASPYIVTGNITVFPGFTLTIQPGVVVKFDAGTTLEIRQASLIALGTSADSITFTSNSSPSAGSWGTINLNGGAMISKFNFCNFSYSTTGLTDNRTGSGDTLILKNTNFLYNTTGFNGLGTGVNCGFIDTCNFRYNTTGATNCLGSTFNNCDFSHNQGGGCDYSKLNTFNNCSFTHNNNGLGSLNGSTLNSCLIRKNLSGIVITNQSVVINNSTIDSNSVTGIDISKVATVNNCVIKYNGVGINDHNGSSFACTITHNIISFNTTGIKLSLSGENISCNTICNNSTYDLQYSGANNVNVSHNYWCTPDSASTEAVIYDGYDNISYGLAAFMPIDTTCHFTTGIKSNENSGFSLYPNPVLSELFISVSSIENTYISVYDMLGNRVHLARATEKNMKLDVSTLPSGVYVVVISASGVSARQKFIKQ